MILPSKSLLKSELSIFWTVKLRAVEIDVVFFNYEIPGLSSFWRIIITSLNWYYQLLMSIIFLNICNLIWTQPLKIRTQRTPWLHMGMGAKGIREREKKRKTCFSNFVPTLHFHLMWVYIFPRAELQNFIGALNSYMVTSNETLLLL